MKHLIKVFIILFAAAAVLPACKKDAVDLENSYMDLLLDDEDGVLTAVNNEIRYVANLSPGSLSGDKVAVTYTSGADPEGYSKELNYWNDELTSGRDVYNVQKLDYNFYVAAETNIEKKRLKVNPDGDKVTITIGDNVFSETVDFKKKYNPLMVADITQGVSGGLYGDINLYNETGERPTIKAYTESSQTPISLTPNSDLGDNGYYESDVEGSHDFGRTVYPISLIFRPDEASGYDYEINANKESDILFVEIGDKTYSMPIDGEDRYYQITMSPAK
jgi:hypothetical protein